MLSRIWQKFRSSDKSAPHQTIVLSREQHQVSRKQISKNALKVLYRLNNAGYQAYLVGGGVRDILLGLSPKDFDIATDATPEEVAKQFKNCRLIGRRFRLAHILFGREIIEVATFRASHQTNETAPCHKSAKVSEQGILVRDNVYGSLEEDAERRDFTVNALYYSADNFTVIDHVGGIEDLEKRQLRLIGDPEARFTEDPVRILRAIRLSAKLNLSIEPKTAAPIKSLSEMLEHVSSARLWDESNKLLLAGHAKTTWLKLCEFDVARHLFYQTCRSLKKDNSDFEQFVLNALNNTDKRIANQQPVTPAFLFAVFLWKPMQEMMEKLQARGMPRQEAMHKASSKVLENQRQSISIPKRFSITIREIWSLQHRFFNRKKRNVDSLLSHPRFRAAYDFLCLRAGKDQELIELSEWWTEIQSTSNENKEKMIKTASPNSRNSRTSKNKRRKNYRNRQKSRRTPPQGN